MKIGKGREGKSRAGHLIPDEDRKGKGICYLMKMGRGNGLVSSTYSGQPRSTAATALYKS